MRELQWHTVLAKISYSRGKPQVNFDDDNLPFKWSTPRIVYVIRSLRPYFVRYLNGDSPVLYIGCGTAWRAYGHKEGWLKKLPLIVDDRFEGYDIRLCRSRKPGPGGQQYYKEMESDLLSMFKVKFGETPIFNSRLGDYEIEHDYENLDTGIFSFGSGPGYQSVIKSPGVRFGTA